MLSSEVVAIFLTISQNNNVYGMIWKGFSIFFNTQSIF